MQETSAKERPHDLVKPLLRRFGKVEAVSQVQDRLSLQVKRRGRRFYFLSSTV